jgi:anti-anti-sigma factor
MDITQTPSGDRMNVAVAGRLDAYWADHLSATLSEVVRQGHHRIRLDCSEVTFLSSAGIAVILRFHKELKRISGFFHIVNPSLAVDTVLALTGLSHILVENQQIAEPAKTAPEPVIKRLERDGTAFDIFDLDASAQLTCRTIGSPRPLLSGTFDQDTCATLEALTPTVAVGVGAFGDSFSDCRPRFGELLSIGGTTVYQPSDGTNVADYLLAAGPLGADVRVLYCLACEGPFAQLVRFEVQEPQTEVTLTTLLETCLDVGGESVGFVMIAETAGLVGTALRRSPAMPVDGGDLFEFPGIRSRLSFTAERAHPRSVSLVGGVVSRSAAAARHTQLRPLGNGLSAHLHAAAFRFSPVTKGLVELGSMVTELFAGERLLGVIHLLRDDRGAAGVGDSEFIRGACWVGALREGWAA